MSWNTVHYVKMYCCNWCNTKLNGQYLGRRYWERNEEEEESRCIGEGGTHRWETGGAKRKRGNAM